MCKFSVCCDQWEARLSHPMYLCVYVCVKGVGDVASSCRGDRGDACLKACGLGQLPPHTVTLCLPYFSNIPHFLPYSFPLFSHSFYMTLFHSHLRTHTHEHTHTNTCTLWPLRKGEGRLMQLAPL